VRKEAVLSSMIEGTQSSLADLLLFEQHAQPGVPEEDAREVSLYVSALQHGMERMRGGFPLSLRLLREIHKVLLGHGRGARHTPGEFRRSQVWIGGTRPGNASFVPPPANELTDCLKDLERFLHDRPDSTPPLVKAALAHVQFETIHPFLDGNGRIGRLLIALQLCADGLLREPILYLSLYFKEHRQTYYDLLNDVRMSGDHYVQLAGDCYGADTGHGEQDAGASRAAGDRQGAHDSAARAGVWIQCVCGDSERGDESAQAGALSESI
jgi:Fic family protein